jgi:hypothetical protein
MISALGQLWAGTALLWLATALPAWLIAPETGLVDITVASLLCLAPMTATLLWCHYSFRADPEQQLLAVLGGTGVRLFVVLLGSIGLFYAVEALARPIFLVWVVVFYLATLTLEVVVVVRRQNALCAAAPAPAGAAEKA